MIWKCTRNSKKAYKLELACKLEFAFLHVFFSTSSWSVQGQFSNDCNKTNNNNNYTKHYLYVFITFSKQSYKVCEIRITIFQNCHEKNTVR